MQRRQYLSLSALVALAGCQGNSPGDGQDSSPGSADQNAPSNSTDQSQNDTDGGGNESGQQDLDDTDVEDPAENETDTENETEEQDVEEEEADDEPELNQEVADRIQTSIENITRAYDAYVRQGNGGLTGITSADEFIRTPVRDRMSATLSHLNYAQREGVPRQKTTASELAGIAEWLLAATDLQHYLSSTVEDFRDAVDTLDGGDYESMGDDFEDVKGRYDDVQDSADAATTSLPDAGFSEIEGLTAAAVESKVDQFNSEVSALRTVDDFSQDMRAVSRRVRLVDGGNNRQAAETLDEAIRVLEDTEFVARDFSHEPIDDIIDKYLSAARTCRSDLEDRRREYLDESE